MHKFYTVDRSGNLRPGMPILLRTDYSQENIWTVKGVYNEKDVISRINELYPNGLSEHGVLYLIRQGLVIFDNGSRQPLPITHTTPMIEAIFELVRRSEFPHLPSRMQSMFAWCDLQDALTFRDSCAVPHKIYRVKSEHTFVADQNLLYLGGSVIGSYELARKYWSGETSRNAKLEAVIPLPAIVGEAI